MIKPIFAFAIPFLHALVGCEPPQELPAKTEVTASQLVENVEGKTIYQRFQPPTDFVRLTIPANSFGHYLQNLPLKPSNSKVHLFDGRLKYNQTVHAAVVDMDTGDSDLQQCADAVMRLRAEYLFAQKKFEEIHFKLTNGFEMDFAKWRQGYRVRVDGNKTEWYATDTPSSSYESFREYLDFVFMYAGTLSLSKELNLKQLKDLAIGDVFIQGGSPGHAVIVVDMAVNKHTGKKVFMLAQSYMPAQEIHVLVNNNDSDLSPWYQSNIVKKLVTPEWEFGIDMLMEF